MARQYWSLVSRFLRQDLEGRFRGNLAGVAWVLIGPMLQLAVFYVVFVHIFKARVPGLEGAGYLAFLALGFWPWFAFSEGVSRATTAIPDHSGLIAKVAMPRSVLPVARAMAAFVLHGAGFIAILLLLPLFGIHLSWSGVPVTVLYWIPLLVLSIGTGLIVSAVQVYVRDFVQVVAHLLNIGFFLTPILFVGDMVPKAMRTFVNINPMTGVVEGTRNAMLGHGLNLSQLFVTIALALLVLLVGVIIFARCERYFEDVL